MDRWPAAWRDAADREVDAPAIPGRDDPAFYEPIGDFQGAEYRRNAFTVGTEEEVGALRETLEISADLRVLDVGCGNARHLRALAARLPGISGTGVDISSGLIEAARESAAAEGCELDLRVGDARELQVVLGERYGTFDVVMSLCQGALGASPEVDPVVLAGMAGAVVPDGLVAVTLFHALFAARHLAPGDAFDPVRLVHHQRAEVFGPDHGRRWFDLWTASYTVREAVALMDQAGLEVLSVRGVQPGAYGARRDGQVGLDDPELLLVARRRR